MNKADETILSDEALWNKFREGDPAAFNGLSRKYYPLMFRYGIRLIPDEDFVKDCIQDIFFDLWSRKEHINATASVRAYLLKCIRLRLFKERAKGLNLQSLDENYCFEIEFNIENKLIEAQTSEELQKRIRAEGKLGEV